MIFLDYETCGLHGMPVLLQYAIDDGEIQLYDIWRHRVCDTLDLLKLITNHKGGIVGFNISFDWFHQCKLYTVFNEFVKRTGLGHVIAEHYIRDIAECEMDARDGPCLKPVKACDLLLCARKGKYQSLMDRNDIRIRKVPTILAQKIANQLHERIPMNPLYFARYKEKHDNPWQVMDIIDKNTNDVVEGFKDVVLKFNPSSALKALAQDALGVKEDDVIFFTDVEPPKHLYPEEVGYAPFAKAIATSGRADNIASWGDTWPNKISGHIEHWSTNIHARKYAENDIVYTRGLYNHFGRPELGDHDSELACQVAAVRWRGFKVDLESIKVQLAKAEERMKKVPVAPSRVKEAIWPLLDPTERLVTGGSTKKIILEQMKTWTTECSDCNGGMSLTSKTCNKCKGSGEVVHPAAKVANEVLEARKAGKEKELYAKLLQAGRLHASFKVIGALSGRMSGADGLNPQGIKATKEVRRCFPLTHEGQAFCGGDFESFEVCIACAVYKDDKLLHDLTSYSLCSECKGEGTIEDKKNKKQVTCPECKGSKQSKKKIHGIFATALYPGETYETVIMSKGMDPDMYKAGKVGVFLKMYGGNEKTMVDRIQNITEEQARKADTLWGQMYPGIAVAQRRIVDMFCSMRQPDGIGHKVYWHEPSETIESLLGFPRYFTLENRICHELFMLAEDPPKEWLNYKITVRRRDRDQTATGAVRSALFGAAFQIQAGNMRAAANHEIQATGAGITKVVQRKVWDLQPSGVHEWYVMPMNIHDEILVTCKPELQETIEILVKKEVKEFVPLVPLINIDWKSNMETWADK